jgi:hypothetical protein
MVKKVFDLRMGIAGALFLGGIVFIINMEHGAFPAFTASLKQALYTFFMGGFIMKLCENLAIRFESKVLSISLAIVVPCVVTTLATYLVHSLKGTPEPLLSTLPTIAFGLPAFTVWALRKRKKAQVV